MTNRKIVSRNYTGENSDKLWLIRENGQKPEEALAAEMVYATNVRFQGSTEVEAGFGCSVIANCGTAVEHYSEPINKNNMDVMTFDGICFVNTRTQRYVSKCHVMYLDKDGKMFIVEQAPIVEKRGRTARELATAKR